MSEAISPLSVAANTLYLLVVCACVLAATIASKAHQQPWHLRAWLILAAFFALLIVLRLFDVEETVRDNVRAMMRSTGDYGERRETQRLIAAGIVAFAGAGAGAWFVYAARRVRGRRNLALIGALGAMASMIALIALRMISLHTTDQLLYGVLKLNWVGDIGLTLAVLGAALFYVRLVRSRPLNR